MLKGMELMEIRDKHKLIVITCHIRVNEQKQFSPKAYRFKYNDTQINNKTAEEVEFV